MDGEYTAQRLADAMYTLGFPWDRIGAEGLKVVERFQGPEAEVETDPDFLEQMAAYFRDIQTQPPPQRPLDVLSAMAPSEHVVVDDLLHSLEDLAGHLPWSAEPAFDIVEAYQAYLQEIKASKALFDRADRIMHAISDLEMRASGRG